MARYSRVFTQFWTDEKVLQMTEDERTLALYLLTCPHGNMVGAFVLPQPYGAADLHWAPDRYERSLRGLLGHGFVKFDESVNLLWLPNFLKHNPIENESQAKSAAKVVAELPRSLLLAQVAVRVRECDKDYLADLVGALEARCATQCPTPCQPQWGAQTPSPVTVTVSESVPVPVPVPATRTSAGVRPAKAVEYTPEFEKFWSEYPRHEDKRAAFRVWRVRLKEGARPLDMTQAAANYAAACRAQRRAPDKCKMASTFLGQDKPFEEWIDRAPESHLQTVSEPKSWAAIRRVMQEVNESDQV